METITEAQKRDLLTALRWYKEGKSEGGLLRTGRFLEKKGLVRESKYFPYPVSRSYYAITEKGINLITDFE